MKLLQSRSLCWIEITNLDDMFLLSLKKTACSKGNGKLQKIKHSTSCLNTPYLLTENPASTISYIDGIFIDYIYSVFLQTQKLCLSWKVV